MLKAYQLIKFHIPYYLQLMFHESNFLINHPSLLPLWSLQLHQHSLLFTRGEEPGNSIDIIIPSWQSWHNWASTRQHSSIIIISVPSGPWWDISVNTVICINEALPSLLPINGALVGHLSIVQHNNEWNIRKWKCKYSPWWWLWWQLETIPNDYISLLIPATPGYFD